MKKLVLSTSIIFFLVFLCGCDSQKPYLTFNSQPITKKTVYDAQKIFKPSQTIYYAILMPKGFKQEYIRMQLIKKPDNVVFGGANIYLSKELFVDNSKKFHIDKFVIHQPGTYVVRFFYGNKTESPFIENILWVKN